MKIISSKEVYRCRLFWVTEDEAVDPKTGLIYGGQDKRHPFGKAAGY